MKVVFGNSNNGKVEEVEVPGTSVQMTYGTLRTEEDKELAIYDHIHGRWQRQNGSVMESWTDITVSA